MLVSQATGHKVVSVATAETVGRVDHVVVDPQRRAVVALELKKTPSGSVLRWADLTAFGTDAVTVGDAAAIGEPDEAVAFLADKHRRYLGKRVLTTAGDEVGSLDDLDFDHETGSVTALVVGGERLDGTRLVGIGTWAVVVRAAG